MNQQLQEFARATLKDGLAQLTPENHRIFALMYARKNGKRSVEDAVAMPFADIVDEIEPEKLDWAMQQVQRSVDKQRSAEKNISGNDPSQDRAKGCAQESTGIAGKAEAASPRVAARGVLSNERGAS